MRTHLLRLSALLLAVSTAAASANPSPDPALRQVFLDHASSEYGLPADEVEAWLAKSDYRQSIVNAMSRPAEKVKPWRDYRPIFISDKRIRDGQAFLARHREALAKVEADTGVPAEMIVAIIGVETSYGGNTGSFRLADALSTLAFDYPRRAAFFRDELTELLLLARSENVNALSLKGSYAGAWGLPLFMPSSFR